MRVKLFTYHFSDNYGALIQAYALRKWFMNCSIDAQFINYHPRYVEEGGDYDEFFNPRKWKKNLTISYLKATSLYGSLCGSATQHKAFDDFRKQYLGVTGSRLLDADQLVGAIDADMLVCGSDQIWSPSVQRGLDPVYFLDFPFVEGIRKISYAPSFGRAQLAPQFHVEARRLISQLDGISVREDSGVEIVRAVSGREAQCVPDPTILLGDFHELLGPISPTQDNHIFCYALRTSEVIREVAEHVAKVNGVRLLSSRTAHQRWKAIGTSSELGPIEWLQQIYSSSMVITNSFHGVALSVIFNKPFLFVALSGKRDALNERVNNLLTYLDLNNRVVRSSNFDKIDEMLTRSIDWFEVNKKLALMRETGSGFLLNQMRLSGWGEAV